MDQVQQIGYAYKDAVRKMNGGWGMFAWNASCYLKTEEFAMWTKICEFSYKNQNPDGPLHLTTRWLYNYFSFDGGESYVNKTLNSLQNIGYITTEGWDSYVDIWINYDVVMLATKYVGKDRFYAQCLRKMCLMNLGPGIDMDKNIRDITPDELTKAGRESGKEV